MNRREALVAVGGLLGASAAVTAVIPVGAQEDDGEGEDDTGDDEGDDANGEDADDAEEENGEDADEEDEENGEDEDEEDAGGAVETVEVGDNYFEPEDLTIEPGTTVEWTWVGDVEHNVNPTDQPDDAEWEGHVELMDSGEYSHTFDVEGDYAYTCDPHPGMDGTIAVDPDADEQAAEADVDVDDLGVPLQKHFVGVATFLAIFVSLVFTFYLLKYGESANTSSPGRDR